MGPLLLAVVGGVSCGSAAPGTGGSTGGLALVTTTAGIQPDQDGYAIMVDGTAQGTVGANDSVMVAGINAGSHDVELADVEFNCATLGQVAFLASDPPGSVSCCQNIFVAESDGSAVTQVTHGLSLLDFDFAANGSILAYERFDRQSRLFVVRPDGTGEREFASPDVISPQLPSLSPDGTKVAYFAYPLTQGDNGPGYEIYVSPTDGGGPRIDVSNNPGDDYWAGLVT